MRAKGGGAAGGRTGAPTVSPPGGGYQGGSSPLWAWDARGGSLAAVQTPASYVNSHLRTGSAVELGATVALSFPPAGTPTTVVTPQFGPALSIPLVAGVQPGGSTDHHLGVVAPDGKHYGLWLYNATNKTASGAAVVAPGAVAETSPASSNAAQFDLTQGIITPADLDSGIPHTLVFGIPTSAVNNNLSVWPSPAAFNDPNCVYGLWMRLDPNGIVPNYGTNRLAAYIDTCLRTCGMMCRDQDPGGLVVFAQDCVNQGGNVATWASKGVTLNLQGAGDSYPIGCYVSGIPWSQLQVLQPPPH